MEQTSRRPNALHFQDWWVRLDNEVLSFGKCGSDAHLSISFSSKSKYFNLHVSRNTRDNTNKPKIEIFRIEKAYLEANAEKLSIWLLKNSLRPLNITKYHRSVRYLPHDLDTPEQTALVDRVLSKFIAQNATQKSKKLKFSKSSMTMLKKFSCSLSPRPNDVLSRIRRISASPERLYEGGTLIIGKKTNSIIRIGKQWYSHAADIELIRRLVGHEWYAKVEERFAWSSDLIHKVDCWDETQHFNPGPILKFIFQDHHTLSQQPNNIKTD